MAKRKTVVTRFSFALLVMLVSCIQIFSFNAQAQESKTLTYNSPVKGEITDKDSNEIWMLDAPGKDVISIAVEREQGTLVPQVELQDAQGNIISLAEHDDTAASAIIQSTQLPTSGKYTVIVGRFQGKDGKTTGSYKLNVTLLGAGPDRTDLYKVEPGNTLGDNGDYPSMLQDELSNDHWIKTYYLLAQAKHYLSFQVTRDKGTLIPELFIFKLTDQLSIDFYKNLLIQATVQADGANVNLKFAVPESGEYLIAVTRKDREKGVTTGQYTLRLDMLSRGQNPASELSPLDGNIRIGTPQHGYLDAGKWQNKFVLKVDNLNPLALILHRTTGTLIPAIKLYDMNSKELASADHDDTFATASINEFIPPAAGEYLVTVFKSGREMGTTIGEYDLSVVPSSH